LVRGIYGSALGVERERCDSKRRRDSGYCDVAGDGHSCGSEPWTFAGDLGPLTEQVWARGVAPRTFANNLGPPTEQEWYQGLHPGPLVVTWVSLRTQINRYAVLRRGLCISGWSW
jgi:hypothetical protein